MPISLGVQTNVPMLLAGLTDLQRRKLPLITAMALTFTAKLVEDAERREMRRVFDRPVDWTLNALYTKPATRGDPRASVGFKDWASKGTPAGRYLRYHIDGGPREHTGFEMAMRRAGVLPNDRYAVPTSRLRLDGHGNVPKGLHTKVLSDLGASSDPTQNRNPGRKSRGRLRHLKFFAISTPTKDRGSVMAPGIYLQVGASTHQQILMWAFVRQPTYRKRFDWAGIAQRTIDTGFAKAFRQARDQIGWRFDRKAA